LHAASRRPRCPTPVLEAYGEEAKFITFGREAGQMPPKAVVFVRCECCKVR